MKFCPNCGAQLPDNASFCSVCGTRLGITQQYQQPYQQQQPQYYQQPQYQQPAPQKMSYMDKVRAARKNQKVKWWMWALIGIGSTLLIALDPLGLS